MWAVKDLLTLCQYVHESVLTLLVALTGVGVLTVLLCFDVPLPMIIVTPEVP